jgi:transcriptional regulator with XRE-family HTH domain
MGRIRIRIGKLAEEAGMTQADVVRITGLNKDLISKYFREDTNNISLRDLAIMVELFERGVESVLEYESTEVAATVDSYREKMSRKCKDARQRNGEHE